MILSYLQLGRTGKWEVVFAVLDVLRKSSLKAEMVSYGSAMNALASGSDLMSAELVKSCTRPTRLCFWSGVGARLGHHFP